MEPPRRSKRHAAASTSSSTPLTVSVIDLTLDEEDEPTSSKAIGSTKLATEISDILRDCAASKSAECLHQSPIAALPLMLNSKMTGLSKHDFQILNKKQQWLRKYDIQLPMETSQASAALLKRAISATLVFGQEEAGTAVCIAPSGVLLTCAHCIAESPDDFLKNGKRARWLLFAAGFAVQAQCIAWDDKRDLALLKIGASQSAVLGQEAGTSLTSSIFPYIQVSSDGPRRSAALLCVGHPGSEDLEASQPGIQTNYDVLHASSGHYRGLAKGQDPQDNSEIGALKHDCWTYWGHSGAPLVKVEDGGLVGLHSSWDDQTGMRRGVGWEALKAFLGEQVEKGLDLKV